VSRWQYRALVYVFRMVLFYWVTVQVGGFLALGIYLTHSSKAAMIREGGVPCWWFAAFHSVSSFNNAGFGLFGDNLYRFADNRGVLVILSFNIMLGNTLFPAGMRFAAWSLDR
jgi:Trk-type K+ transport system membrane component